MVPSFFCSVNLSEILFWPDDDKLFHYSKGNFIPIKSRNLVECLTKLITFIFYRILLILKLEETLKIVFLKCESIPILYEILRQIFRDEYSLHCWIIQPSLSWNITMYIPFAWFTRMGYRSKKCRHMCRSQIFGFLPLTLPNKLSFHHSLKYQIVDVS